MLGAASCVIKLEVVKMSMKEIIGGGGGLLLVLMTLVQIAPVKVNPWSWLARCIGKAINGGFGMVLDGSERVDTILKMSMPWDTMIGVSRRNWAGNPNSMSTVAEYNELYAGQDHITMPYIADDAIVAEAVKGMKG